MAYPENVLAEDEQVVLHRHPHVKRLIVPVLALLLATACAAFAAGVVNPRAWDPTAKNVVFGVIWGIWLVVVGWLTIGPFLGWLTTHFVVTDRRVMYRHGLLTRSGIDIALARINSVEFVHGFFDRILRTGTLVIESASQEPLEFYDIPRVERVHSLLYREVFDGPGHEVFDRPFAGG
ncbi:PH domain-containing protein [Mycolicibacter minnesotensis]